MSVRMLLYVVIGFAAVLGIAGLVVGFTTVTTPNVAMHTGSLKSCNAVTEISAVLASDPNAVAALKNAQTTNGTVSFISGNLPITAYVAGTEYIVQVGTGSQAFTCHTAIAQRSLQPNYAGTNL